MIRVFIESIENKGLYYYIIVEVERKKKGYAMTPAQLLLLTVTRR